MSNVIYRPLDRAKNEIRLVTLIEENHGRLECTLSYTSLDTPQPYEALSYCWGDQTEPKEILLDNHSFLITANLRDALRAIFRSTDTRTMWVDAICINQEDIRERNQQVLRMRKIYQAASHVIIWLGLKSTNSDLAINLISKRRVPASWLASFHEVPKFRKRATKKLNKDPSAWEALEDFFHRPWWSRVWIVQEYISARRATFMCGETKLTRTQLERAFGGSHFCPDGFEGDFHELTNQAKKMQVYRHKSYGDGNVKSCSSQVPAYQGKIFEVLADFGHCQSSDPRDGLFALSWLVNSHKIIPDYLKSTLEVYLDVIKQDISCTKSLDVLIHRYRTEYLPDFPPYSWHSWADRIFGEPQYFDWEANILSRLCASGWKRPQMEMDSDCEQRVKNRLSKENLSHDKIKYSYDDLMLPGLTEETLGLDNYFFIPLDLNRRDKFCTTEKRYMAWVPKDTQKDDLICLLFSGSVPFVLRPNQDGTYRMIGACYVHGIMYGEGMGNEDWVEKNKQTFKITMHGEWPYS